MAKVVYIGFFLSGWLVAAWWMVGYALIAGTCNG